MPLYGTLRTMPLRDLLQWIERANNTGTLKLEHNRVSRWIVFRDGRVVSCSSDAPPQLLGHFLLAQGRITEAQLREALEVQESSGKPLGRVFVEMGALADEELHAHLEAQAEESILGVFEWPDAVFRFHEQVDDMPGFAVSLQVEDVLRRGEERSTELARIRETFPDHEVVLRHGVHEPPQAVLQNPMARKLYNAIDGKRTIAEILLYVHGSEFIVTRFLCELHRAGFVAIGAAPAPERQTVAPPPLPEPQPVTAAGGGHAEPPTRTVVGAPAAAARAPAAEATAPEVAREIDPATILDPPGAPGSAEDDLFLEDLEWDDDPLEEHSEILDIPDLFAESSDVEALEDSVPHQVDHKLERVRSHLAANNFEEALILLDELYDSFPDDDALRRLMAEAEASFRDMAYKHYLPQHMIPLLKTPLDQLEAQDLSPTEYFLLSRIDGVWDVKSIIQVAPIREIEALMTLKRLRERGVIELRETAPRSS